MNKENITNLQQSSLSKEYFTESKNDCNLAKTSQTTIAILLTLAIKNLVTVLKQHVIALPTLMIAEQNLIAKAI